MKRMETIDAGGIVGRPDTETANRTGDSEPDVSGGRRVDDLQVDGRLRRVGQGEHPESQRDGADPDPDFVVQRHGRFDPPVSQECAVLAAEILERGTVLRHDDPRVAAGNTGVVDEEAGAGISADEGFARIEGYSRAAAQNPAGSRAGGDG